MTDAPTDNLPVCATFKHTWLLKGMRDNTLIIADYFLFLVPPKTHL